jgi:hypothetical protein
MHIYRRAKIGAERYGSKTNDGRNQDKGRQEGERCRAADNRPKGDWSVAITAGTSRGTGRALFFSICPLPRLWVRECYPTRGSVHVRFVPLLRIRPSVLMQSRRPNPSSLLRSHHASITMHPRDEVPQPMAGARSLTSESVAGALRAFAGRAAAISRYSNSLVDPDLRGTGPGTCNEALATKRVQRPDQSNSRLPESEHAMLKINIPQHSRAG